MFEPTDFWVTGSQGNWVCAESRWWLIAPSSLKLKTDYSGKVVKNSKIQDKITFPLGERRATFIALAQEVGGQWWLLDMVKHTVSVWEKMHGKHMQGKRVQPLRRPWIVWLPQMAVFGGKQASSHLCVDVKCMLGKLLSFSGVYKVLTKCRGQAPIKKKWPASLLWHGSCIPKAGF